MDEEEIINRFFIKNRSRKPRPRKLRQKAKPSLREFKPATIIAIGDDAALIPYNRKYDAAITTDTLIVNRHFRPKHNPYLLGKKSLAVNLSDLAAMAATPRWFLLSLTMPDADGKWLQEFSDGLFDYANYHDVELIGGNLSRGELAISITAIGLVRKKQAVSRRGAKVGDDLWVTGSVGLAALGRVIESAKNNLPDIWNNDPLFTEQALNALNSPEVPVTFALDLGSKASAMIDISDGLWQDCHHLAISSQVGMMIDVNALPQLPKTLPARHAQPYQDKKMKRLWRRCQLTGGDDYQLLFCSRQKNREMILKLADRHNISVRPIGRVIKKGRKKPPVQWHRNGNILSFSEYRRQGYQHFR